MPKRTPPYPLQAVLDQLRAMQQQRQGDVSAALREVRAARERLETLRQRRESEQARLQQAETAVNDAIERGAETPEIHRRSAYVDGCRRQVQDVAAVVEAQRTALRRADQRLQHARAHLTEAARKVQLQQRHHQNWLAEQKHEQQRREQNQASEIARLLHQRRARDP